MKHTVTKKQLRKIILEAIDEEVRTILEKDDRCTRIAKKRFDVWPSAYASGAVVRCRKGKIWKNVKEEKKKAGTESSKESSLRDWFKRKGAPGKSGGWVDCNTCRNGKCKPCGRKKGEKRAKYPSCRPTPAACKEKGRGKSWGKKSARGKK